MIAIAFGSRVAATAEVEARLAVLGTQFAIDQPEPTVEHRSTRALDVRNRDHAWQGLDPADTDA